MKMIVQYEKNKQSQLLGFSCISNNPAIEWIGKNNVFASIVFIPPFSYANIHQPPFWTT